MNWFDQPVRGERILLIIGMPFLILPVLYIMVMEDKSYEKGVRVLKSKKYDEMFLMNRLIREIVLNEWRRSN